MNFSSSTLRIWSADAAEPSAVVPVGPNFSAGMRLSDFYREWYVPIVLKLDDEEAAVDPNAINYLKSIDWWRTLTGDKPLHQIDEVMLVGFEKALRKATYKRGLAGQERTLGDFTVAKHLKNIRAVLFRTGPKSADPKRPAKGLLTETPHISVSAPTLLLPKTRFSVQQARQAYAACDEMAEFSNLGRGRPSDGGPLAPLRWRARIATMYYTGLRIGTVLRLERSMIVEDDDGFWFMVPGRIVHKTKKFSVKAIRPELLELIRALPEDGNLLFPWDHSLTHLRDRHERLQRIAGLTEPRDMHAWKRTHVREVGRLGLDDAMRVAQRAGDHADRKTTEDSYCNLGQETARALPALVEKKPHVDPNQRHLF
ncbi:MAG: hypothetical protein K8U03_09120 [Planctomycetia bacterium]|nr:hypothetical protein [Planctomycetia bacterium]